MLHRAKDRLASTLRRLMERPPVLPTPSPATFLVRVRSEDQATEVVTAFREAFGPEDGARLVLVAQGPAAERARQLAQKGSVEVVGTATDDVVAAAFSEEATTVGRFRRLHARHEELQELLRRLPTLRDELHRAAAGHPRAAEVDRLLEAFLEGYEVYARTGSTPVRADQAMRQLFVITSGELNRVVLEVQGRVYPPAAVPLASGLLAGVPEDEVATMLRNLDRDGFHVFAERAPNDLLDALEAFARRTPLLPHPAGTEEVRYDETHPTGTAYYLQPGRVLQDPLVRDLYADTSMLAMAQRVLGCQPVLSHVGMWWSTTVGGDAVSEVAQLYHFDMDKPAFIQFFVYVTDVGPDNGPHCLVRGSHRDRPMPLQRDGRIPDEEIRAHYNPEDVVEILGPRGTMFSVQTTAWHKGKPLTSGHRLVFQWVYSATLFGAPHAQLPLPPGVEPEFLATVARHPRAFERTTSSRYDLDSPQVGRWALTPPT